jgi:release factor-specific protein-(glutamine-N5) methyltransferase/tRNA threonylcarbamoyl adenosine modification protein (Sua5/YciO/YrdC/YwlC family)
MEQWTIRRLLEAAAGYLGEKGSSSPRLDAELLLADTLGLDRVDLYTQYDRPLTAQEIASYRALIARRAAHEPVAYIRGRAYFRRLSLGVGPAVLIPRPETEELVDLALESLRRRPPWRGLPCNPTPPAAPVVADVGTGSGAIALSLAQEAGVQVLAIDESEQALAVAAANAAATGLADRLVLRRGDLLSDVPAGSLDLIVSNPPYVRSGDISFLAPDVRLFEPVFALDGGPDGLSVYRRLVPEAARALGPGGTLLLEVGEEQAAAVSQLAREAGFALVNVHKDLSRKERMVEANMPGAPVLAVSDLGALEAKALRSALEAGAVIGLPTDTVYGLAARWDRAAGVCRLFAAKQRSPEQPVAVLFPSVDAIKQHIRDLEPIAARVLETLLPGPFTCVVATTVSRPEWVGAADSVGVRVPDHPDVRRLLTLVGTPLAATSANVTGCPDAAALDQVDPAVLAHCSLAVTPSASSAAATGVASTVIDLRPLSGGSAPLVLREGTVGAEEALRRIKSCV